jgi:SAM-dependent methyltransferase
MLDAMEESIERNEQKLIKDRPLVLGIIEELPFKDKSFDFIIASHVLEHTDNPEKFLAELMRVGKAGYIETPDGWFEKICAFTYHRLEVSNDNGELLIKKKENWKPESIAYFWEKLKSNKKFMKFLRLNPEFNHMRYYWKDEIKYKILNPETDAGWAYPDELKKRPLKASSWIDGPRGVYLLLRRKILSQTKRNKRLSIDELLRCPSCHSEDLYFAENIKCLKCDVQYSRIGGVPRLFPVEISGFNKERLN